MNLLELVSYISVDKTGFDKGLGDAQKTANAFAEKIDAVAGKVKTALAAAFSIAAVKKLGEAIIGLANDTAAYGDRIDKQSQVLGMSRKAYQEWDYILGQNGISIDSMSVAMKTMNSNLQSAIGGSKEAASAFAQLGLHINELDAMSPEDQFEAVVRALQKMPPGADKSAMAVKMFGKVGMDLLPLLNSESASIDELRQRAYELGIIMSDDAVDASVAYGDAMDDLKKTFNGIKYALGTQLLPALTKGVQSLTNYAAKISHAYQEKGLMGVFETLVEDFKNIKWPTWDDVQRAITDGWNSIVEGVKGLAKLVFGENVDGEIDWPTWEEIGQAIGTAWGAIVQGVQNLGTTIGKAIFGENVDGDIDWPTWEEIGEAIGTAWQGLINGVASLGQTVGQIIFGGDNVDGSIDWPTWDEIGQAISDAWRGIVNGVSGLATGIGKVVFGKNVDGEINWPTWDDVQKVVEDGWRTIVNGVASLGTTVGKAIFGENVDGDIDWPSWTSIGETISNAWQTIVDGVASLGTTIGKAVFGDDFVDIASIVYAFQIGLPNAIETLKASDNPILSSIGDALSKIKSAGAFIKTLFSQGLPAAIETLNGADLPVLGSIIQAFKDIQAWAQNAMDKISEFFGTVGSNIQLAFGSIEDDEHDTSMYPQIDGPYSEAKGLWSVPYDGFIARLHRGERVLSASQARRQNGGGADLSNIGSEITRAIRAGMEGATVRSYINGRDVTREVSNDLSRQVKARRFAT